MRERLAQSGNKSCVGPGLRHRLAHSRDLMAASGLQAIPCTALLFRDVSTFQGRRVANGESGIFYSPFATRHWLFTIRYSPT
jgi:hypothetical protein